MSSLVLMLMLQLPATTQFLVSTKAGLVNYVQGTATVKAATSVPAGKIIQTGAGGAVEILLNPGSYLRMGENSRVVLDQVELYDIAARILEGSMIIETNGFSKESPLKVTSGDLKMEIIKDGIYLFADGKVVVVDGRIRDASNGLLYGKGYEISNDQGYRARKVKTFTTALELWSQKRDAAISNANLNVSRSLRQVPNLPIGSLLDVWLWYPAFGSFIYMPGARYRSPYGYIYQTAAPVPSYGGFAGGSGGGSGSNSNFGGGSSNTTSGGGGGGVGFSSGVASSSGASSPTPSAGAQAGASTGGHSSTTLGR
jgi:FecR-like protein